jgi:glycosyltransferase involved in cell wall biosynthesis
MSRRKAPRVSVLTPVYNGDETLSECIESVLSQTEGDFEYLIQDNCSTDRTREITEGYARRDPRIRLIRNAVLVSAMENHQLLFDRMAPESRYGKVVQADDWIFPECLERMLAIAGANPSVGIVGAYELQETRVALDGLPYGQTVFPGREICRRTLLGEIYVFGTPSCLLFRADLLRRRKPFYDEARYPWHYDAAACYEVLRNSDYGFVHQVLTFTRRHGAVRSGRAVSLESATAERVGMLLEYGPAYLDRGEYEQCLRERVRRYYDVLGICAFRRPGQEFWDYHRASLARFGLSSSRARLLVAMAAAAARTLARPLKPARRKSPPGASAWPSPGSDPAPPAAGQTRNARHRTGGEMPARERDRRAVER